ncbi:MAG TPA: helix-turn-helix domain-containing protein [Isosphaeraceae bacterium]|nr:helix-turn-helix domain-containing protein [Isosphaeraceae bacterium]
MSHSALRSPDVKPRPQTPSSQPWDLNRAILASDLGQSSKVLLLVIVDHARHGRSKCTASTGTLAREAGMTGRHVRRLLPALEAAGWIQIERATGSRQSRHTIYLAPREGNEPFVKLHEVGHSGPCSRTFPVHEVGHMGPTNGSRTAPENVSRFAPIQGMQNCNPPVVHPPVADPAAQAAALARGWRAWAAEGGAP